MGKRTTKRQLSWEDLPEATAVDLVKAFMDGKNARFKNDYDEMYNTAFTDGKCLYVTRRSMVPEAFIVPKKRLYLIGFSPFDFNIGQEDQYWMAWAIEQVLFSKDYTPIFWDTLTRKQQVTVLEEFLVEIDTALEKGAFIADRTVQWAQKALKERS